MYSHKLEKLEKKQTSSIIKTIAFFLALVVLSWITGIVSAYWFASQAFMGEPSPFKQIEANDIAINNEKGWKLFQANQYDSSDYQNNTKLSELLLPPTLRISYQNKYDSEGRELSNDCNYQINISSEFGDKWLIRTMPARKNSEFPPNQVWGASAKLMLDPTNESDGDSFIPVTVSKLPVSGNWLYAKGEQKLQLEFVFFRLKEPYNSKVLPIVERLNCQS